MSDSWRRFVTAMLIAGTLAFQCGGSAYAVNASAFLSGTVTNDGVPVAGTRVSASGNNLSMHVTTNARGHFSFPPLPLGTYDVEAQNGDLRGTVRVNLGSGGATVEIVLTNLKEIHRVVVSRAQSDVIHGSGSDVVVNQTYLTQMPFNNSFSEMEIQMPGAVRGANGVVHMNGDHGVINYMLDGVALPQELNRDIGGEINLNDLSFIDLIEGAYPAQYGLRFGSVFNMATRSGAGPQASTATRRQAPTQTPNRSSAITHRSGAPAATTSRSTGSKRRGGSILRTSTRPITTPVPSGSSLRPLFPRAGITSPRSRSSTATARFRFPTTSPTANRPRPMITKLRATRFWRFSTIIRLTTRD